LKHDIPKIARADFVDPALGMGVPITLFIDVRGTVTYRKIGVVTTIEELERDTEKYLGVQL
jgi:hypothetical protein